MITKSFLFALLLMSSLTIISQNNADDLLGQFMTSKNDAIIEITKSGTKYSGKIIWNLNPDKLDINNPDVSKRTNKVRGLSMLNNFDFKGSGLWENGTIYDPKNGKTYSCKINMDEKRNLNVRGFLGISLLGRTEYFIRVNDKK